MAGLMSEPRAEGWRQDTPAASLSFTGFLPGMLQQLPLVHSSVRELANLGCSEVSGEDQGLTAEEAS